MAQTCARQLSIFLLGAMVGSLLTAMMAFETLGSWLRVSQMQSSDQASSLSTVPSAPTAPEKSSLPVANSAPSATEKSSLPATTSAPTAPEQSAVPAATSAPAVLKAMSEPASTAPEAMPEPAAISAPTAPNQSSDPAATSAPSSPPARSESTTVSQPATPEAPRNLPFQQEEGELGHKCKQLALELPTSTLTRKLTDIRWLHFPKCGTSFISTLWNYGCSKNGLPIDLRIDAKNKPGCGECYDFALEDRYPRAQFCDPKIIGRFFQFQHAGLRHDELKSKMVVGFFRKPSQRLISAYHNGLHCSGFKPDEYQQLQATTKAGGVAAFARFPGIAGCTARMLTGGNCAESKTVRSQDQSFDGGQSRLKKALEVVESMSFVGITERWDDSICLFHRMFGGRLNSAQLMNFHSNHKMSKKKKLYDESSLSNFSDLVDEEIYAAAVKRFEKDLGVHVGTNGESACGAILEELAAMSNHTACSCQSLPRQCGASKEVGIDCGRCPPNRMNYLPIPAGKTKVQCKESIGTCAFETAPSKASDFNPAVGNPSKLKADLSNDHLSGLDTERKERISQALYSFIFSEDSVKRAASPPARRKQTGH
eukprot:TRINITY_DN39073_c0_g1_i1.p1 TRINITY_DN39073_c0_g1~~TRINITY_DN39073_c0_g1_i1.p1  ORF type:complete len:596 (-),score=130.03 TRINITY_DN39073_c0_g1_i1:223-2010(-)